MDNEKTKELGKVEITAEELQEYKALKEQKAKEEARARAKQEREMYRSLAEGAVEEMILRLRSTHEEMKRCKQGVLEAFRTLIETKEELIEGASQQRSHTFSNADSTARITIGYHQRDAWDTTVELGISKVEQYLQSLAKDENAEELVEMVRVLLAKDKLGNLQADKVLLLAQQADKSDNPIFKEGVSIIQEAYKPEKTKVYIRAEERNKEGKWVNLPLSMTEV